MGILQRLRRLLARSAKDAPAPLAAIADYGPAFEASLRLDAEMGTRLDAMVARTEDSALAIMGQVRALCDDSAELVTRLEAAAVEAAGIENELGASVADLDATSRLLRCLPERLARDKQHIDRIAEEIRGLAGLAETVRTISMQSHLLSINAAIEASRAGPAGAAFRVVADEVRVLAANSDAAAARIGGSLDRTEALLREGLELNAAAAAGQFAEIADSADALLRLKDSLESLSGSYRSRFEEVAGHGQRVVAGAGEVLGQLQYQDIVRQCVERLQLAVAARNAAFGAECARLDPARLARLLDEVLAEYLATEAMHGLDSEAIEAAGPAIELF